MVQQGGAGPKPSLIDRGLTRVAAAYASLAVLLTTVALWGESFATDRSHFVSDDPAFVDVWVRWDSNWYAGIAGIGYAYAPGVQSPVAFFPSYPMSVRLLAFVVGDVHVAGVLITVVCGLISMLLFWNWLRPRLDGQARTLAMASLMLYPYAFFIYGAMYGDALFLMCVLAAFTALERRWFLAAGLIGAVATAGRPVGLALVVGLVVRTLELLAQDRALAVGADGAGSSRTPGGDRLVAGTGVRFRDLWSSLRDVRIRHLGVVLALAGLGGWMFYLWWTFGEPLAFAKAQSSPGWDQGAGPRTWFKVAFGGQMLNGPWDIKAILFAQALVCGLAILALPRVFRRFGWGYTAYVVVVLGIPLIGSKDFLGCGRYVMMAFPVFAVLGVWLTQQRQWVRFAVPIVSALGLLVAAFFYGRGVLIS